MDLKQLMLSPSEPTWWQRRWVELRQLGRQLLGVHRLIESVLLIAALFFSFVALRPIATPKAVSSKPPKAGAVTPCVTTCPCPVPAQTSDTTPAWPSKVQPFLGLWLAWAAAYASRRIAANQLTPKLLERFNGDAVYQSRRYAYKAMQWWMAGDRQLLMRYEAEVPHWVLALPDHVSADASVGVSQLLGFISELQHYAVQSSLSVNPLRELMRDRFCWFVRFLCEFATEVQAGHIEQAKNKRPGAYPRVPFPFVYKPHSVKWLIRTFNLQAFATAPTPGDAQQTKVDPDESEARRIQGLGILEDLESFKVLLDSNLHEKNSIFERRNTNADDRGWTYDVKGTGGFIRLRIKHNPSDPPEVYFGMLDVGMPQLGTFERSIEYLDKSEIHEWYLRLTIQGATPQAGAFNPHALNR